MVWLVIILIILVLYILIRAFILFPYEIYKSNLELATNKYIFSLAFSLVGLVIAIPAYFQYKDRQTIHYLTALPSALEINSSVLIHEDGFRETCAIAIFELSESTLSSINSKGLKFFEQATKPRGHLRKDVVYEGWSTINRETAHKQDFINCRSESNSSIQEDIDKALKSKGGYYSRYKTLYLLVVPSLGYAIYSYNYS